MSDFLTRLALRQLGQIATIEPRVAPLYEEGKATRNASFAEDSEYRPVTNTPEAAAMPAKTAIQTPGRLVEGGADPVMSLEPPPVQTHGKSQKRLPRADSQFPAAEYGRDDATVEGFGPSRPLMVEPPHSFSGRTKEPTRAESLPRHPMPMARLTRTVPVAPVPPSHSGLTEHSNEFTAPAVLGREADRRSKQAQDDQETPVHVTIGRIEVTAMTAATPAKRVPAREQTMSLDDYLARRQRRER